MQILTTANSVTRFNFKPNFVSNIRKFNTNVKEKNKLNENRCAGEFHNAFCNTNVSPGPRTWTLCVFARGPCGSGARPQDSIIRLIFINPRNAHVPILFNLLIIIRFTVRINRLIFFLLLLFHPGPQKFQFRIDYKTHRFANDANIIIRTRNIPSARN